MTISRDKADAVEIYAGLENLYGDLQLLGYGEITLDDVYANSKEALKVLVKHQQYRDDAGEGPTGCREDGDELSLAVRKLGREGVEKVINETLI
jgi:hypothetical protein